MIQLTTPRLLIRTFRNTDIASLRTFEESNAPHFATYTPKPTNWEQTIQKFEEEYNTKTAFRFLAFDTMNPDTLIAACNYTQIFRGPFQACYLGFKISQTYEGKGLMFETLNATCAYMFEHENLHRIMANYNPSNLRSEKLLQRLGFQKEGYAKSYLYINEKWEDHVLTSLINTSWRSA